MYEWVNRSTVEFLTWWLDVTVLLGETLREVGSQRPSSTPAWWRWPGLDNLRSVSCFILFLICFRATVVVQTFPATLLSFDGNLRHIAVGGSSSTSGAKHKAPRLGRAVLWGAVNRVEVVKHCRRVRKQRWNDVQRPSTTHKALFRSILLASGKASHGCSWWPPALWPLWSCSLERFFWWFFRADLLWYAMNCYDYIYDS